MSKIKILGVIPSIMPSTILSILKPLMKLQNCGLIKLQLGFSFFYNKFKLKRTNILVLCRNCEVNDYKLLCKAIEYQKKIIFDIDDNFYDIDVKTDLGEFIDTPVKYYSTGMYGRLAFTVATQIQPDILIVDEIFAGGDINFIDKAKKRMDDIINESNIVIMV